MDTSTSPTCHAAVALGKPLVDALLLLFWKACPLLFGMRVLGVAFGNVLVDSTVGTLEREIDGISERRANLILTHSPDH